MISEETVQEFRDAIKKEYCHNLSVEEAREMITNLVGYFDVLAQINHQDKLDTGGNQ